MEKNLKKKKSICDTHTHMPESHIKLIQHCILTIFQLKNVLKVSVSINPWLVLSLGNKTFSLSLLYFNCKCFMIPFFKLREFLSIPIFLRDFCCEQVLNFFKCLFWIIDMIIWFLFIILLMLWIILNDFWILNQFWIPGINPTESSFIIHVLLNSNC